MVKNLLANTGNPREVGSRPRPGRSPGEGNGNLLWYFLPGESHGQRSLVGYGPWGRKELDITGQLSNNNNSDYIMSKMLFLRDVIT